MALRPPRLVQSCPRNGRPHRHYRSRAYGFGDGPWFHTEKAARDWETDRRADRRAGIGPEAHEMADTPFGEFAELYLAGKRWGSQGTRDTYTSHLRNHVIPVIGKVPMGSITAMRHLEPMIAGWQRTLAPSTVATVWTITRIVFRRAVDEGLRKSPCDRVAVPNPAAKVIDPREVFTVDQVLDIVAAAGRKDAGYGTLIYVAAFTGLRQGEVFGLRRRHLDLTLGTVTVAEQLRTPSRGEPYFCPPKTGASRRTIPIAPEVAAALRRYTAGRLANPDEPIFLRPDGKRLRRNQWCSWTWPRILQAAGVERADFHGLRAFYASGLIRAGLDAHTIAARMGHASTEELAPYARLWPDADERTRGAMSALIAAGGRES